MKIAITGASGQIGLTILDMLLASGHEVNVLAHSNTDCFKNREAKIFKGSTTQFETLAGVFEGCEIVYHLAAIISINGDQHGKVWEVNVNGTKNVLDACVHAKVKRFIHFSSIHAFEPDPNDKPLDESRPLVGVKGFAYECSKAAAQRLVQQYVKEKGLNAVILNPTAVLGPNDVLPSVKGKMLIDFYREKIPVLTPGGYDWVDTRDVARAAIAAMHSGIIGEPHLLSGNYYSVKDLARLIENSSGVKTPRIIIPMFLLRAMLPFIYLWGKITGNKPLYTNESLCALEDGNKQIDNSRAKRELGFSVTPIEQTLRDSYSWFKDNKYI